MSMMDDLKTLDWRDPGRWPFMARIGVAAVFFVFLSVILNYSLVWMRNKDELASKQQAEQALRQEFRQKHSKAVNLEVYKQQLIDIERSFGALLRQLPSKTEVDNLLVDISQTGLAAALQDRLFEPEAEIKRDFYAEKPIKIRLAGSYHQFATFASGIASLPRIVTLHDVIIRPAERSSTYDNLLMDLTAKTYRYLDDEELAAAEAAKAAAVNRRGN